MTLLRSRLLLLIVMALVVTSLLPMMVIGALVLSSYQQRMEANIISATRPLLESGLEGLETRATTVASALAAFLREREGDLLALAALPPSQAAFTDFASTRRSEIWSIDSAAGEERRVLLPLYREIALIDTAGQEQIRVETICFDYPWDCQIRPAVDLRDLSTPRGTTFGSETYFTDAASLERGQVLVTQPIGYYVTAADAYRSLSTGLGQRFQGLIRYITPLYEGDQRVGYLMLALDHTHVMEFVAHIDPTSTRPLVQVSAETGSFAYLVGIDGAVLAHPAHQNIAGLDRGGEPVPPFSGPDSIGVGPANLRQMGFLSPAFPDLMERVIQQPSGFIERFTVDDEQRALAYALVDYRTSHPDGYGIVVMYVPYSVLTLETSVLRTAQENELRDVVTRYAVLLVFTGLLATAVALVFARGVVSPVRNVTQYAQAMETRDLTDEELQTLIEKPGRSEASMLARAFGRMAQTVRERETEIAKLLTQTDEALALRVQELQSLGELGRRLTSSLNLDTILQAAVDALYRQTRARGVRLELKGGEGSPPQVVSAGTPSDDSASSVMIPIELDERVIGRILIYRADQPLEASQRSFVEQLAAWVGVAVRNAQLYAISQEQRRQLEITNREVVKANRLKDDFLATMSHELRTPMNVIIGYCDLLLEGLAGELDDDARRMLQRVHSNALKLLALINDILDISKIEAGKLELHHEGIDLQELVSKLQSDMSLAAAQKGLTFTVAVDPALPRNIVSDSARLTQVVSNLLSNAFKFTSEGSVHLEFRREDAARWSISVRDTGIGIPDDALQYIFEEFRQVDASPTRAYGGTGLGLAIVSNIVRLMGGQVQVSSTVSQGSTFTVILPLHTELETALE